MNKEKLKLIIFSLLVFIIVTIIVFIVTNNVGKIKKTIFLGPNTRISLKHNKLFISNDDIVIDKTNANIISKNKEIDGYVLSVTDDENDINAVINNCHAYNVNGEKIELDSPLIAYTKDIKVNFIPIMSDTETSIEDVSKYLEDKYDISLINNDYIITNYFDYDNDSKYEYVYTINFNYEEKHYSLVLMEKNDNYYLIDEIESDLSGDNYISLEFVGILDLKNDNKYKFIIQKSVGEYGTFSFDLYNFDGYKFHKFDFDNQ